MNGISPRLLAAVLVLAPLTTFAQVTTLTYQSSVIEGTSTYLPSGFEAPVGTSLYGANLPTTPFLGTLTTSITLNGSLGANDLELVGGPDFRLNGVQIINGAPVEFSVDIPGTSGEPYTPEGPLTYCLGLGSAGCINLTTANGAITGATIEAGGSIYNASSGSVQIGPGGDSVDYLWGDEGPCVVQIDYGVQPGTHPYYTGPTVNPCSLSGSISAAGVWTVTQQAPEIDPGSAASGLALLAGALVVGRGRRQAG